MTKRAAAPPYRGEGPHALWHVSEDATISSFAPHRARTAASDEPLVWAIDTRHVPLYWFPRECPRCTFWAGASTSEQDVVRFLGGERDRRVHVVEAGWLERIERCRLYLYRLPPETFTEDPEIAGYWVSRTTVVPLATTTITNLVERHAAAGITLRAEPSLWPLWDEVVASTLEFSGIRLHNASAGRTHGRGRTARDRDLPDPA
jgi:hypothetical protein